jgi:hypothetical protein
MAKSTTIEAMYKFYITMVRVFRPKQPNKADTTQILAQNSAIYVLE